jgi:hypothetical protein
MKLIAYIFSVLNQSGEKQDFLVARIQLGCRGLSLVMKGKWRSTV